jgi:hypothetical protein
MVRPVREQLEHDRLIRFLLNKYKKKFEAIANVGDEHVMTLKVGQLSLFPDVILTDGKKLAGVVEVETGESVNNLEALAQWVHFSHARVPFHLYVPVQSYDAARRLCEMNHVAVAEVWTYRGALDGFDLVRMYHNPSAVPNSGARATFAPVVKPTKALEPEPAPAPVASAKAKAAESLKVPVNTKDTKGTKIPVSPKTTIDTKGTNKATDTKKITDAKNTKDTKKALDTKKIADTKSTKDAKKSKDAKDTKKSKDSKSAKASKPAKKSGKKKR